MSKKSGEEYIQELKDLFIEGCANGYYNGEKQMKDEAEQIMKIDNLVKEFTKYMNSDDKENYDFKGLMDRLKIKGDSDE